MGKKLLVFLVITAILSSILLPMPSFTGVNVDVGDAGGSTGKGSNDWAITLLGRGVRIGIYFVEGREDNFANGLRPENSNEQDDPYAAVHAKA